MFLQNFFIVRGRLLFSDAFDVRLQQKPVREVGEAVIAGDFSSGNKNLEECKHRAIKRSIEIFVENQAGIKRNFRALRG